MTPNLGRYLNKTILVCITGIFEDEKCRPYKLLGVELFGLWLDGADLANRFLTHEYKSASTAWAVFVPFSQIACVVISTASATPAPSPAASPAVTAAPASDKPAAAAAADEPAPTEGAAAARKKPKVKNG
jgi:hypothetical protein